MLKARIARAKEMLTGPTAVNSVIVACGNGVQALASLAATMLVTRSLGPSGFGIFAVALGAATTASPIMDLGLNTGFLRHAARAYAAGKPQEIIRLTRAYAQLSACFFVVVAGIGAAAAGWFAREILHFPHVALLRWACVGALSLNLLVFTRSILEARQRFRDVALVTAGTSLLRLVLIAALWAAKRLTPETVLLTYLFAPVTGLLYVSWLLPDVLFARLPAGGLSPERRELIAFGSWAGIAGLIGALAVYLDTTLINRWCSTVAVGYYAAAYRLAFVMVAAAAPIASVLRVRASAFETVERLESFLKKAKVMSVVAGLGVAAVWICAPLAVRLFLGDAYVESVPLLRILAVGTGCMFANGPFWISFYALGSSRPFALLNLAQLFTFLIALAILIPRYGIEGAAAAFALVHALIFLLTMLLVRHHIASTGSGTLGARA